jgi:hypothetical protein
LGCFGREQAIRCETGIRVASLMSKEPTAHSVKRLSGSCASPAAMLKYIRPKPRYAVGP